MKIVVLPEAADEFEDAADYYDKQQAIWVLAIAHGHRKPEYWIGRRLHQSDRRED